MLNYEVNVRIYSSEKVVKSSLIEFDIDCNLLCLNEKQNQLNIIQISYNFVLGNRKWLISEAHWWSANTVWKMRIQSKYW